MMEDSLHRNGFESFVRHVEYIKKNLPNSCEIDGVCIFTHNGLNLWSIQEILDRNPEYCIQCDSSEVYPIHIAALMGDLHAIEHLLEFVSESSQFKTCEGTLPIHLAAYAGHKEVCVHLLHHDPSTLTETTQHDLTAEQIAWCCGDGRLAEILSFATSVSVEMAVPEAVPQPFRVQVVTNNSTISSNSSASIVRSGNVLPAKYAPPSKQAMYGIHHQQPPHQLDEVRIPSLPAVRATSTLVEVNSMNTSQILLSEFQRGNLLEEDVMGGVVDSRKDSVRRDLTRTGRAVVDGLVAANNSELFNLSEDAITSHMKQQQQYKARYTKSAHGTRPAGGQIESFLPNRDRPQSHTRALNSPFLFHQTAEKPSIPLKNVGGGVESKPRPTTASARIQISHDQNHHKVNEPNSTHSEPVPGLIITSAVIMRGSPVVSPRKRIHYAHSKQKPTGSTESSAPQYTGAETETVDAHQENNDLVRSLEGGFPPPPYPATCPAPAQQQLYSLRKPSRPITPRSPVPARPKSHSSSRPPQQLAASTTTAEAVPPSNVPGQNDDVADVAFHSSRGDRSMSPTERPETSSINHVTGIPPPSSPGTSVRTNANTVTAIITTSPAARNNATQDDDDNLPHRFVRKVTIHEPSVEQNQISYPSILSIASKPVHNGFTPSKPVRPHKAHSSVMKSPAVRNGLDLVLMVDEAVRLAEDPGFVPTIRPVYNLMGFSSKVIPHLKVSKDKHAITVTPGGGGGGGGGGGDSSGAGGVAGMVSTGPRSRRARVRERKQRMKEMDLTVVSTGLVPSPPKQPLAVAQATDTYLHSKK